GCGEWSCRRCRRSGPEPSGRLRSISHRSWRTAVPWSSAWRWVATRSTVAGRASRTARKYAWLMPSSSTTRIRGAAGLDGLREPMRLTPCRLSPILARWCPVATARGPRGGHAAGHSGIMPALRRSEVLPHVARIDRTPFQIRISNLSHDGRGVARREDGKAVFVAGALPGELVLAEPTARSRRFDEARTLEVLEASPERVLPRCPHFGTCGG